jgi:hypothetical protein
MEGMQAAKQLLCKEAPAPPRALAAWLSTARSSSTSSPKPQSFSFSTIPEQSPHPEAVESPSMILICQFYLLIIICIAISAKFGQDENLKLPVELSELVEELLDGTSGGTFWNLLKNSWNLSTKNDPPK